MTRLKFEEVTKLKDSGKLIEQAVMIFDEFVKIPDGQEQRVRQMFYIICAAGIAMVREGLEAKK